LILKVLSWLAIHLWLLACYKCASNTIQNDIYDKYHSTETTLVHLLDSIYHAGDNGLATLLSLSTSVLHSSQSSHLRGWNAQMEILLSEEQGRFRRDRSKVHQILILRLIARKQNVTEGKTHCQLLHWLPKGIWLDQTWRYLGIFQFIGNWNETGWNSAEYQWKIEVSSASWRRKGRLVQNHSQYMTRRSDIANNFHRVSWKSDVSK